MGTDKARAGDPWGKLLQMREERDAANARAERLQSINDTWRKEAGEKDAYIKALEVRLTQAEEKFGLTPGLAEAEKRFANLTADRDAYKARCESTERAFDELVVESPKTASPVDRTVAADKLAKVEKRLGEAERSRDQLAGELRKYKDGPSQDAIQAAVEAAVAEVCREKDEEIARLRDKSQAAEDLLRISSNGVKDLQQQTVEDERSRLCAELEQARAKCAVFDGLSPQEVTRQLLAALDRARMQLEVALEASAGPAVLVSGVNLARVKRAHAVRSRFLSSMDEAYSEILGDKDELERSIEEATRLMKLEEEIDGDAEPYRRSYKDSLERLALSDARLEILERIRDQYAWVREERDGLDRYLRAATVVATETPSDISLHGDLDLPSLRDALRDAKADVAARLPDVLKKKDAVTAVEKSNEAKTRLERIAATHNLTVFAVMAITLYELIPGSRIKSVRLANVVNAASAGRLFAHVGCPDALSAYQGSIDTWAGLKTQKSAMKVWLRYTGSAISKFGTGANGMYLRMGIDLPWSISNLFPEDLVKAFLQAWHTENS